MTSSNEPIKFTGLARSRHAAKVVFYQPLSIAVVACSTIAILNEFLSEPKLPGRELLVARCRGLSSLFCVVHTPS